MTTTVTESGAFERVVKFQLSNEQINEAKKGAARTTTAGSSGDRMTTATDGKGCWYSG